MRSEYYISWVASLLFFISGLVSAQQTQEVSPIDQLNWQIGPATVSVGDKASLKLPEGFMFLNAAESRKFMELTQNIPGEAEYVLAPVGFKWWSVFSFSDVGFVKDDETLDSNALLESIKEGTKQGNEERKNRGWGTMSVNGWRFEPRYDKSTQLLEWAFSAVNDADNSPIINYNTRLLGRTGVMELVLVADPKDLDVSVSQLKQALHGYSFVPGETYAEFREGDHVAEYGLAALVAGGAAAVATKKGLWAVMAAFLLKGWKLILLAFFGLGALFKKRMGGDKKQ